MDYKARATKLETLSREDLKRAAKVLKLKGYGNKNKTELISAIMEAGKEVSKAQYDAESAILKVREALGLSTSGNIKSRTQGLRKSKKEDAKTPKQIASEAMSAMREALAIKDKPKLKRQFVARMKAEMEKFEKELDKITSQQPAVASRKAANKRYKDSSELKQDI
tara:strand:+ start:1550 stop:2047 length:498 start_codon:yes stop_codon:yes gene_type:complete